MNPKNLTMGEERIDKIRELINEIITYFDKNLTNTSERQLIRSLKSISLDPDNFNTEKPSHNPKIDSYLKTVNAIEETSILSIKKALLDTLDHLTWRVDNGDFYELNCGIGRAYLEGNMNVELIGPSTGAFKSAECRLGLFFLEPNIFYKDHNHPSPELYLNLTNGTKWRFDGETWQIREAATIVYNWPRRVHAMKVDQEAFLSVWFWPYGLDKSCSLVDV